MFVLRRELIVGLYTNKFEAAVPIFAVALLNTVLLINLTGAVLRAFEDLKFYRAKLYLWLMPLTWLLLYAGMKLIGLPGVMLALVIARALDVTLTTRTLARRLGMKRGDWHYIVPLLRIALAAAGAALLTHLAHPLFTGWLPLLAFLVGTVIFGLAYLPLAFVCGAVSDKEKELLRELWRKFADVRARLRLSSAA